MSVNVLPYRLLRRDELDALATRAAAALARWSARWAVLPEHGVSCVDACELGAELASGAGLRRRVFTNGAFAWVQLPGGAPRAVEQLLFGLNDTDGAAERHLGSRLAAGSVDAALEDLQHMLLESLCAQASAAAGDAVPVQSLLRRGGGGVVCTVTLGALAVRLLLPAPPAAPRPARRAADAPPLATLHVALAHVQVPLTVELCRTELTLGYLHTLALGDVLALPAALDQPMQVTGPGGDTVCHAHLGASSGCYAAELIKPAP